MAERGDWLIPSVNEKVFAEKPILYFWGALASSKLTGQVDEFSLRLPAAGAALTSALLTYVLALPYLGRRRTLLMVALLATSYQFFWASRAVQMDILVLASTLGVILPLTRMLDFKASSTSSFALAGLAAGLGFLSKGPVTLVLPGIVVFVYAASYRSLNRLFHRHFFIGVATAIVVSLPWYGLLWLQGETAFLYEVLLRQNFTRFVDAWDHHQPWWYFLKYLWIDYAPWAWLLPAAWFTVPRNDEEQKIHRLSWIWIIGVIGFFSLSESKRAPYILPIAPAVAILASGVFERWIWGWQEEERSRVAARFAFAALAILLLVAGGAVFIHLEIPAELQPVSKLLGLLLAVTGYVAGLGVLAFRRFATLAPSAILVGFASLYFVASVWALPAVDPLKSARGFSAEMNEILETSNGTVASFLFWDWRSGYSYYGERSIPGLDTSGDLLAFWQEKEGAHVLVEGEHRAQFLNLIPDAHLALEGKIGSREAFLYTKSTTAGATDFPQAEAETETSRLTRLVDPEFLSQPTSLNQADLPVEIVRALAPEENAANIQHRRILAYEVEWETSEGFESEIFVNQDGHSLLTIVKPDGEDLEEPKNFAELPGAVQDSIKAMLGDTPIVRLQREIEWGFSVYAVKWQGLRGVQELKVLEDGRVLFVELPRDEPIPEAISKIATGAEVEALLLDIFVATDSTTGEVSRAVLATGWPLSMVHN